MRFVYHILFLSLLFCSCGQVTKKSEKKETIVVKDSVESKIIAPLEEGEFVCSDKDFGDIIELKGTSLPVEQIFRVSGLQMIVKDSIIIVKNRGGEHPFMVYSLPEFKFIKYLGIAGRGPEEFQSPRLVKADDNDVICYVYDGANENIYSIDRNLNLTKTAIKLKASKNRFFGDKQLHSLSKDDFMYVEKIKRGKAVFHTKIQKDSVDTQQIKKLNFNKSHKNWAAYIGDFGVSKEHNRMVYAYKKFKRLIFMDLEGKKTRVLDFKSKEAKHGNTVNMLAPDNVTHYWGMSAQKNYVYVLYSGRTPIQVGKENDKTSGYIYVEQFDWNGKPIRKFKLDHWGYFCVNENEDTIYLASYIEEQPFLKFSIPKMK